jgi:hypothetical protein
VATRRPREYIVHEAPVAATSMLANIGTSDSGTLGAFVCPSSSLSLALSRADESFQPGVVIASPLAVNSND